jgi:hypothetical protein
MLKKILSCLVSVGIITIIFGVIYAGVQQNYRQSAYDPEIQMSEDGASFLSRGGNAQQISAQYSPVNFAQSLAPFVVVYNSTGNVLSASGNLDGNVPTPPLGVFDSTLSRGQDRISWQPRADVRIAMVITPYSYQGVSGFVLAGRNMKEIEARTMSLAFIVFVGWFLSLIGLGVLYLIKMF